MPSSAGSDTAGQSAHYAGRTALSGDRQRRATRRLRSAADANLNYDLQDATGGTSNTWTSNGRRPEHDSSPAGLC